MQQLIFDLVAPAAPTFANFVAGPNAEAVAVLTRAAAGQELPIAGPPRHS